MAHPTDQLLAALLDRTASIALVGLGYVGLPLACCLARRFTVIGFDLNSGKVAKLQAGKDPIGEVGDAAVRDSGITFSSDPAVLAQARFFIVCVPTPIDDAQRPDLRPILSASELVGARLQPGSVVVYESTVYPGCTEEDCVPVLERASRLRAGADFAFGYSPERINPGDREHTVDKITKVVSGSDGATLDCVAGVYGAVITAGVHRAASVKVAEAAKVIENTQRDLNIALVNELALIFHRLDIDTRDVLAAAGTKWNFLRFEPGLVGGHCIGVDPYYLTHRAEKAGYHPQVILAGRRINDGLGAWIAQETVRLLIAAGGTPQGARVLVLGITFKEDCPDCRNSKVVDIIAELKRWGCVPVVCDPVANADEVRHEYGIDLVPMEPLPRAQACVVAVKHGAIRALSAQALAKALPAGAPVMDVKGSMDRAVATAAGLQVWRL
jgi:UDP-N-acetyl-D-galactosamine dehydrogenase